MLYSIFSQEHIQMSNSTELFTVDNKGKLRTWKIEADETGYKIYHGIVGGAIQTKYQTVPHGKVNRTIEEQIELEMNSRINSQRDDGYVNTIEEATSGKITNTLGMPKPMLAKTLNTDTIDLSTDCFIQRKYDGNRCLIYKDNGVTRAYSRNGKLITSIDHILNSIDIPNGRIIDGELYCHGETLQTIVSWIKKNQPESANLKYHAYDVISEEPFAYRQELLQQIHYSDQAIEIVPTQRVSTLEEIFKYFKQFREEGYEGAIVRTGLAGYEDGKRSASLLKLKEWQDAEYVVIDILPSKDGWARLVCQSVGGKQFTVTCHGTHEYKTYVLENKEAFLYKVITIECAYFTKDGLPFHPVAKGWRE